MGEKLCKEVLEIKKEKRYMIYFHWIYLLLYVVITVPAIITVLMDNRQPAKTMAWILVFFFIPFVGIIFYFFFGYIIEGILSITTEPK